MIRTKLLNFFLRRYAVVYDWTLQSGMLVFNIRSLFGDSHLPNHC